jgi:hypothetical protein
MFPSPELKKKPNKKPVRSRKKLGFAWSTFNGQYGIISNNHGRENFISYEIKQDYH